MTGQLIDWLLDPVLSGCPYTQAQLRELARDEIISLLAKNQWKNTANELPRKDGVYAIYYLGGKNWHTASFRILGNVWIDTYSPDNLGGYSIQTPDWWMEILIPKSEPAPCRTE